MISLKTFLSGLALFCALAPSQAQDKFRVMENVIGSMYKFFLMIVEPAGNNIVRCMFGC